MFLTLTGQWCRNINSILVTKIVSAKLQWCKLLHFAVTPRASSVDDMVSFVANNAFDTDAETWNDVYLQYNPSGFLSRLLVGMHVKTKLASSELVYIPHRVWCKYLLIVVLGAIAVLLTPNMLPAWLGFEWATPRDLCKDKEKKLYSIRQRVERVTNYTIAISFANDQMLKADCMHHSAELFYHGRNTSPPRFKWPSECTPEIAGTNTIQKTVCSGGTTRNNCNKLGFIRMIFARIAGVCRTVKTKRVCHTVNDTDTSTQLELLRLFQERETAREQEMNSVRAEPLQETANDKATQILSGLFTQVDIGTDLFIVYSILAILVGSPIVVFKREKTSRVMSAVFGLSKLYFVAFVVVAISVYSSAVNIFGNTNFRMLLSNFGNDPCWVDPEFSSSRIGLIVDACNNISAVGHRIEQTRQRMDDIYYKTKLFGLCEDRNATIPKSRHPALGFMDIIRRESGDEELYNPAQCNATWLNEITSTAPSARASKFEAVMGSGAIAELLLKFIVSSFALHLFSYIEPMAFHGGKVELWGRNSRTGLSEREMEVITRFARDRHLLALLSFTVLLFVEVSLIIYSVAISGSARYLPADNIQNATTALNLTLNDCPQPLKIDGWKTPHP